MEVWSLMKDDRMLQELVESRLMDAKQERKVKMEEESRKRRLERMRNNSRRQEKAYMLASHHVHCMNGPKSMRQTR